MGHWPSRYVDASLPPGDIDLKSLRVTLRVPDSAEARGMVASNQIIPRTVVPTSGPAHQLKEVSILRARFSLLCATSHGTNWSVKWSHHGKYL